MTNRMDEILASRSPDAPTGIPKETAVVLEDLTRHAGWPVLLAWLGDRVNQETVDRDAPNVSALLLIEGRRTVVRELKALRKQVTNDDRSRHARDE